VGCQMEHKNSMGCHGEFDTWDNYAPTRCLELESGLGWVLMHNCNVKSSGS